MWDIRARKKFPHYLSLRHFNFVTFFSHLGQRPAECELGEWSQWSSCMKKNKTCGFKKGSQSRVRVPILQIHSPDISPAFVPSQTCTPQTERRKCNVPRTPCVRGKYKEWSSEERMSENQKGKCSDYWPTSSMKSLHQLAWWLMEALLNIQSPVLPPVRLWPTACWLGLVWPSSQKDTESLDFSACKQ